MNAIDDALLAAEGWTVECESPFEIRHEDGSFATLQAAKIVLQFLRDEASAPAQPATEPGNEFESAAARILPAIDRVLSWVETAEQRNDWKGWETAYSLVFSQVGNQRITALLTPLNIRLEYYDPDSDYSDDVRAYAQALKDLRERLVPFLEEAPSTL